MGVSATDYWRLYALSFVIPFCHESASRFSRFSAYATEQPQAAAAAHAAYDPRYAGGNKFDLADEQTSF